MRGPFSCLSLPAALLLAAAPSGCASAWADRAGLAAGVVAIGAVDRATFGLLEGEVVEGAWTFGAQTDDEGRPDWVGTAAAVASGWAPPAGWCDGEDCAGTGWAIALEVQDAVFDQHSSGLGFDGLMDERDDAREGLEWDPADFVFDADLRVTFAYAGHTPVRDDGWAEDYDALADVLGTLSVGPDDVAVEVDLRVRRWVHARTYTWGASMEGTAAGRPVRWDWAGTD